MPKDNKDKVIIALGVFLLILIVFLFYSFVITPAITSRVSQGYNQGQVDLVNNILLQIQQTGVVRLPVGENQIIVLVPYTAG